MIFVLERTIKFVLVFRADYFLNKPLTHELISCGNEHVLRYLYKLQKISENI